MSSGFNNYPCLRDPFDYTSLNPYHNLLPTRPVSSECASCLTQANAVECCGIANNIEAHHSRCNDPSCGDVICSNDCLIHEDCCNNCDVDCELDCGLSFDRGNNHALGGTDTQLIGDQTARTFEYERPLGPLRTDAPIMETCSLSQISVDTGLSRCYPAPAPQINAFPQIPQAIYTQHGQSQATPLSSTFHGLSNNNITPATTPPIPMPSLTVSPSSARGDSVCSPNAHYDHVNLPIQENDSASPFPSLRCQWADSNGTPCGMIVGEGEDMHQHLRTFHAVRNEKFCRWAGCHTGVWGPDKRSYASSVERHTWGHSGYRPYICKHCQVGFAGASILDEHIASIHLHLKIFACDKCSHRTTSATNLKRHMAEVHDSAGFRCEFCAKHGKTSKFGRGPNLVRHFRTCKYVKAEFPEVTAATKAQPGWLPPGYKKGHHGLKRAKIRLQM